MDRTAPASVVVLEPRGSLARTALLAFALGSIALFGPLYLVTSSVGTWPATIAVQTVTTAVFVACLVLLRRMRVQATRDEIVEHRCLGPDRRFPTAAVTSCILARTYRSGAPDTIPQLVLRDARGERLLRLHGQFWSEGVMRRLTSAAGLPLQVIEEPMSAPEFLSRVPGAAYWFEGRLAVRVGLWAIVLAACAGAALGLMTLLRIHSAL